jgi:acid phosphatase type 7
MSVSNNVVCLLVLTHISLIMGSIREPMAIRNVHGFPDPTHKLANEFQLLHIENIITIDELIHTRPSQVKPFRNPLLKTLTSSSDNITYEYSIINVSPLLITNDDIVEVSFYSTNPSDSDWIAAYAPLDINNLSSVVPVKFGYCDEAIEYISTGYGKLSFNLTNLRSSIGFVYYTNDLDYPVYLNSSSLEVHFKNTNEPLRPRVVATGDYDVFNLLWSSSSSETPILRWGTSSGVYTETVSANTSTVSQSSMCGSPANSTGWRDLGLIHTASFVGMKALSSSKVYYIFGDDITDDYSKEYVLTVPPLPGTQPDTRPTTVILYDDLGRGSTDNTYTWNEYGRPAIYTSMAVGAEVMAGNIDAIYHGGDISYATGYIAVWDFFLDMISPMASGTIYLTTVGNHESDWPDSASYYTGTDSGGECGKLMLYI